MIKPKYFYLEREINPEQLIKFPSENQAFNETYREALNVIHGKTRPGITRRHNATVRELYIVRDRSGFFTFVSAKNIGADRTFQLTDIRGVVRAITTVKEVAA
jgi:hypothetical protein